MSDFDEEAFVLDLVRAINEVADEHDAPKGEKLAATAALGSEASRGSWYDVPERGE